MNHQTTLKKSWQNLITLTQKIGGTETGKRLAKQWSGKFALALVGIAATTVPANAIRINASYSSEMSLDTTQLIQDIANTWEEKIKDPVTLNINFHFSDALPENVLGASKPAMVKVNYKDYLTVLGQDGLSDEDILAVQNQLVEPDDQNLYNQYLNGEIERKKFKAKDTKTFDVLIDETFNPNGNSNSGQGFLDDNDNKNNQKIWLTRANAKALNLLKADDKKLDADIIFSNAVNWDFDPSNGISDDAYDFRTVVLHEIGHALGVVSGADVMELLAISSDGTITDDDISYVTPLNTYVYSDESSQSGVIDLRLGQGIEKYMSLDGGATRVTNTQGVDALFSTGGLAVGGDGYQTSHWRDSDNPLGIMNPTLEPGESIGISELDLLLLDTIGWDLTIRSQQLMDQVGLDWEGFREALEAHHQVVVDTYGAIWESYNPEDTIREELKEKLWDLYRTHLGSMMKSCRLGFFT